MRKALLFFYTVCLSFFCEAQHTWQWASIGGSNTSFILTNEIYEWVESAAIDKNGNSYAIVKGANQIFVGNDSSKFTNSNGYYYGNAYSIVSWSCDGKVRWIKTIGPSFTGKIATDTLDGVYFIGRMQLSNGNFIDTDTVIAPVSQEKWNYIAKYDTSGNFKWVQFPDSNLSISNFNNWPYYIHLQAAPNGDLHILSYLPPGIHANGAYIVNDTSYHILKFNKNGQFIGGIRLPMSVFFDQNGAPYQHAMEAAKFLRDQSNNRYYVCGTAMGPYQYPNFTVGNDTIRANIRSIYAISFDQNGNLKWVKKQTGNNNAAINAATLDHKGHLFISGQIQTGTTWNGSTLSAPGNILQMAYVICMDSMGNNKWTSTGYSAQNETSSASSIAISNKGVLRVSGENYNTFSWGNYSIYQTPPPGQINATTGLYLAQLDPNTGSCIGMDSARAKYGYKILPQVMLTDRNGNFYLTGGLLNLPSATDTLATFGTNPLIAIGGTTDFFMAKYGDPDCQNNLVNVTTIIEDNAINVFPNPALETITLSGIQNETHYEIYDNLGRIKSKGTCTMPRTTLTIADFPKGLYFLQINSNKTKERKAFKIIKL